MKDTNQLPDPELGYIKTDKSNQPAFSARQMREAMKHATTEPVLTVEREPDYWSGGHFCEGTKPHINPMKVWSLPIGTKLYTDPAPSVPDAVVLDCYDAGILNDFGGGNIEWWQDYIRAELGRAHDFYQSQIATPQPAQATQASWTDDQMISFAAMILMQGPHTDSIEMRLQSFRRLETLRGNITPAQATQAASAEDMKVYDSIADRYFREATQAEVTDERAAFEEWATNEGKWPKSVDRDHNGCYLLLQTSYAWTVWQARAILTPRPERVPMTDSARENFFAGYESAQQDVLVCRLPPNGWACTRKAGHDGPCAAVPTDDEAFVKRGMDRLREAHHGITAHAKKETP